jgi:cytochrome c oxidase subunit 2
MHSPFSSRSLRPVSQILAFASLILLSGCDLNFWKMQGHQTTMVAAGPVAASQLSLFYVTCWVTLVIFIIVGAVLAYATVKFKARSDADEHAEPPPQGHGNPMVEMALIAASIFSLVIIAIPTLKGIWYTHDVPEAQKAEAYNINATGYQWWFKFEYPEKIDGGAALVTGNELVIPAGRPVRIQLRTVDVIHSFWVPKLAGKVDMIPNRGNFLWLQADEPGYFWGQCAEYCGDSHAVMRFRVVALAPLEFAAWVAAQKAPARNVAATAGAAPGPRPQLAAFKKNEYGYSEKWADGSPINPLQNWVDQQKASPAEDAALIAEGKAAFWAKSCIACHTVRGHVGRLPAMPTVDIPAMGVAGPDLTHVGSRTTIAGGLLENSPAQLARWVAHPDQVKPGNKMYATGYVPMNITVSDTEAVALAAYLTSLK